MNSADNSLESSAELIPECVGIDNSVDLNALKESISTQVELQAVEKPPSASGTENSEYVYLYGNLMEDPGEDSDDSSSTPNSSSQNNFVKNPILRERAKLSLIDLQDAEIRKTQQEILMERVHQEKLKTKQEQLKTKQEGLKAKQEDLKARQQEINLKIKQQMEVISTDFFKI